MADPRKRFPWITLLFVASAVAASVVPGIGQLLQYDRAAVGSGAVWRLAGGQFCHWSAGMAAADLLVVLVCGSWLEVRSRQLASWTLLVSVVAVGLAVHLWSVDLAFYRGSSGVACGLVAALTLDLFTSHSSPRIRRLGLAGFVLLVAKIVWELASGDPLLADSFPRGFTVVASVHLVGAAAGCLCVFLGLGRRRASAPVNRHTVWQSRTGIGLRSRPSAD